MRYLPNILTVMRMLSAIALLLFAPFGTAFYCVYLGAGLSDLLDGAFARRFGAASALGARLDSIADLLFTIAACIRILPIVPWERWMLLWAGGIAALRFITLCIGLWKYRALPFLHTWANKLVGALLFLFPVLYAMLGLCRTAWLLCFAASLASAEEFIITCRRSSLDRDFRGLLLPM